jgi:hypothetical protein
MKNTACAIVLSLFSSAAFAAEPMAGMDGFYGRYPVSRDSSGTSWQPDSSPPMGIMEMKDDWMLMYGGYVNGIYTRQGGKRGDEKVFSSSMAMFMAQHPLEGGTLGLRGMLSLDPAMGKHGYPLLLQTGETANGTERLIDHQHPHEFIMELSSSYSHPLTGESSAFVYAGYPGEPALGPPAYMHRFSSMDDPEAPLSHHWMDSTHITFGVVTLGYVFDRLKLDGSVFNGREPDQHRWDLDTPRLDSYSGRATYNLTRDWSLSASVGHLRGPEQLEPDVDTNRFTAFAIYNRSLPEGGNWQTSLGWGRNRKYPGKATDAFLLESGLNLRKTQTFFGRVERVEKDELFREEDPLAGTVFTVYKASGGYIYDFPLWGEAQWGIGGLAAIYFIPEKLKPAYGEKEPKSFLLFLRARL